MGMRTSEGFQRRLLEGFCDFLARRGRLYDEGKKAATSQAYHVRSETHQLEEQSESFLPYAITSNWTCDNWDRL